MIRAKFYSSGQTDNFIDKKITFSKFLCPNSASPGVFTR
jgi:hypothetical protein